ncbi:MAG: hypothetical protein U0795_20120 [Pirellulales bacterium]
MSLLLTESFDLYAAVSDATLRGWTLAAGMPTIETTVVKDGRACLSVDGNERLKFTFGSAQSVVYLACWFRFNYDPLTAQIMLRVGNATTDANLRLQLGTDRKLSILDAVGVVRGTSTVAYAKDTWHFLELRIVHSDSTAANDVVLWMNGQEAINLPAGTDTAYVGTTITDFSFVGSDSIGNNHYFDSLCVWNTAGSAPWNSYVAEYRMSCLRPSGNGSSSGCVGSDGNSVDNYLLVDDPTSDADTTYVQSDAALDVDLYVCDDLPASAGNVLAVHSLALWKKTSGASKVSRQVCRIGGTNYESGDVSPTTAYAWHSRLMETSPATSAAWSVSEINAAEFGVKDQSGGSSLRLTQLAMETVWQASPAGMVKAYVGGVWKKAPAKAYVGGTWKTAPAKVYVGGAWKPPG